MEKNKRSSDASDRIFEMRQRQDLIRGFLNFSPEICVEGIKDPNGLLEEVFEINPFLPFYIMSYNYKRINGRLFMIPEYNNRDVPIGSIKRIYKKEDVLRLLVEAAEENRKQLTVCYTGDSIDLSDVMQTFLDKYGVHYPYMMGFEGGHWYRYFSASTVTYGLKYRIGKAKMDMMDKEVNAEAERLAKLLFLPGMPPEVKAYLAHNYLVSTVTYVRDRSNPLQYSYTQSAYGALIKHRCVCQGYSEAFSRLMAAAGVKTVMARGKCLDVPAGTNPYHAWNIITINGRNLHVDVTWDDPLYIDGIERDIILYDYFCKPDSVFKGMREWEKSFYPSCTAEYDVLGAARKYVSANKSRLLANGVPAGVLDI